MPYSGSANKAMNNFKKEYGSNWQHVYYGLANKRTGGTKGKNRGSKAANAAFAKGATWSNHNKRRKAIKRSGRRKVSKR